jgi:hypothetical protein
MPKDQLLRKDLNQARLARAVLPQMLLGQDRMRWISRGWREERWNALSGSR